jgi:hypothetical protein
MTNAIKVLLQMTSVSLQPVPSLGYVIVFVTFVVMGAFFCNLLEVGDSSKRETSHSR